MHDLGGVARRQRCDRERAEVGGAQARLLGKLALGGPSRRLVTITRAGGELPERSTDRAPPLPDQDHLARLVDRHDRDGTRMDHHLALGAGPVDEAHIVLMDGQQAAGVDRAPIGRGLTEVLRRSAIAVAGVNAHPLSLTPLATNQAQDHSLERPSENIFAAMLAWATGFQMLAAVPPFATNVDIRNWKTPMY